MPSAVPTAHGLFPQQDLCDFMHCLLQHDAVSPIANSVFGVSTRAVHHCRKCKSDTAESEVLFPIFQVALSEKDKHVTIHDIVQRKLQEASEHPGVRCLCGTHNKSTKSMATLVPADSHLIIAINRATVGGKITTNIKNAPLRQSVFTGSSAKMACLVAIARHHGDAVGNGQFTMDGLTNKQW